MKNLVIENVGPMDFPETLTSILEHNFKENREMWYFFHEAFWPENREDTINRFMSLPDDSNIICEHVFEDFQQLELMVELFLQFKKVGKKINFYIHNPSLDVNLREFVEKTYSSIEPKELWEDGSHKERVAFKQKMNENFFEVLEHFNIYQIKRPRRRALEDGNVIRMTKEVVLNSDTR